MNAHRSLSLALVVVAALPCGAASAQPDEAAARHGTEVPGGAPDDSADVHPAGRVELWLRAGVFLPSDDALGEVYSGARVPLIAQADWRIHPALALFGGLRYLRAGGQAIGESGTAGGTGDDTATRLTTTSGRFGALLVVPARPWDVRFGAGVTVTHYSETWSAAGASARGTRAGWLAQGAVARRFGSRWSAGASLEYSGVRVPAGSGEFAAPAVDLGGLDVLFGMGIRF